MIDYGKKILFLVWYKRLYDEVGNVSLQPAFFFELINTTRRLQYANEYLLLQVC